MPSTSTSPSRPPDDLVVAGRMVAVGCLLGVAAVLGSLPGLASVHGWGPGVLVPACLLVLALLLAAAVARVRPDRLPGAVWVVAPVAGVVVLVVLDLVTGPVGGIATGVQTVGLLYVVVLAAVHLRPAAAWWVTAVAVGGAAVIALVGHGVRDEVPDAAVVAVVLAALTAGVLATRLRHERLTQRLTELATIDPLTGLATRRLLEETAGEVLRPARGATDPARGAEPDRAHRGGASRGDRRRGDRRRLERRNDDRRRADRRPTARRAGGPDDDHGTALLLLDLDHFKALNDTHGHLVGDDALVHVATLLRRCVPDRSTVARFGGDELAVLIPSCTLDGVRQVAQAVIDGLRSSPLAHPRGSVLLSASVGVAHTGPGQPARLAELYGAADAALYRAKLAGRGRAVVS